MHAYKVDKRACNFNALTVLILNCYALLSMMFSKPTEFIIVNLFLGVLDLPDVVTASKPYLLSPNVVNTPDPSSHWELQQHCKYDGEGTTIAIVDTGIQKFHPAFASRKHPKSLYQLVGDASLTFGDSYGHGTLCAGVACGDPFVNTFDGSKVKCRGVAPKATLVVSKAYETKGSQWYGVQALGNLVHAMTTQNLKLDVVVLSSGCADKQPGLHEAIKALDQRDVIVVCAASNEGAIDKKAIWYPARYRETICIGSNDRNGKPSSFSPVGEDMDFLALGEHIIGPNLVNSLTQDYGTSFAAPAVGGLICLILQAVADKCPSKLKQIHNGETMKKLLQKLTSEDPHNKQEGYGSIKRDQVKNFFSDPAHFITRLEMDKSI